MEKVLGKEDVRLLKSLMRLAVLHYRMGDYAKAEPLYQRALKIREKVLGPEHPDTVLTLNNLAVLYDHTGDSAKAEPLYQRALKSTEKAFGLEHPNAATCLNNLALHYQSMGDSAKAEPLYQRALKIREKVLGAEHPATARSLENLANTYYRTGDYAKAEPLFRRALNIEEKVLTSEHPDTAITLNDLANLYYSMANYTKAEPLYQRALKIYEKVRGPEHPDTALTLNNLAVLYDHTGDYAMAEPLHQRALRIREKVRGPEHPDTATSLDNLAGLYYRMGDYTKAEPLLQRALRIWEKAIGPERPDTATSLNNLAGLYFSMGNYAKAEPLLQRALRIWEKALGPEHLSTATSLRNLAELYHRMGDYAKAELLHQRALKIREKMLGPEHPDTAISLNDLANLYYSMANYTKAELLHQRALKIREKILGPEHPDTAISLNDLANLYYSMANYTKAEPLCQRALKMREKVLGPEHPDTASSLNDLATLYSVMGDYAKAEPLFQRALKIQEKVLGPEHRDTALSLNNLALLYGFLGNYSKAESLLQRALRITEKALGSEHPDTAIRLDNLSFILLDINEPARALDFITKAQTAHLKTLANVLSFTTEQQRLAYQAACNPYSGFASLGDGPSIALAILRHKGIVLDSVLEDRLVAQSSRNPEDRAQLDQLRSAKQRLTQLLLEVPKDLRPESLQQRAAEREKLSREVEQIEATLARRVAGLGRTRRALGVTVEQVQKALPKQAVLVELLRYNHYLGKNKFEARYGATVIPPSGKPQWIVLSTAAAIEKNIAAYQAAVRGQPAPNSNLPSSISNSSLSTMLRALHQQLWSPVEAILPRGTTTVILSPDGALNFVSFATLLTPDDRFLGQQYALRYVASGRDLVRERPAGRTAQMLIYANPDFAATGLKAGPEMAESMLAMRSLEQRDWAGMRLPALPGTAKEGEALAAQAKQWQWPARIYAQAEATEAQLRQVDSPRILHLATHGFFLPASPEKGPGAMDLFRGVGGIKAVGGGSKLVEGGSVLKPTVVMKNPMHRSGLALAGAQGTLDAWGRGETPPASNDGIVTAEEVGGLNLAGTWLVTLSACDTATGDVTAGEGVMGLRRGFIQAGAQNLLMTLWSVADTETAQLMVDFYAAAHRSGEASQGLGDVQRDWLVRLRKERGLEAAVRLAGPFILSSQGAIQGAGTEGR